MKTRYTTSLKVLAAATAGLFLFTGCWNEPTSSNQNGSDGAYVEGQVNGDVTLSKRAAGSAGIGVEGAVVTVARLKSDGSLETVSSGEIKTDVDGRFSIDAKAEGRGLVVVAEKAGRRWKAVISSEVKKGSTAHCRPLDLQSSAQADIYAKVEADGKAEAGSFSDIASHVDANVAAKAQGNVDVTAFAAAQVETEAKVRRAVLTGTGKFSEAQIQAADSARLAAEARLETALDASADANARAQAQAACDQARLDAFVNAGISLGEFAKARAAAFHAMVADTAGAKVDAATRLVWIKKIALEHASVLEIAIDADAKAALGSSVSADSAEVTAAAGAALETSIQSAASADEIDSCFAHFRQGVSAKLQGSLSAALGSASSGVVLTDSSKAVADLRASLKTATTDEAVAGAYARFYVAAAIEIQAKLSAAASGLDSAKAQALTREALILCAQGGITAVTVSVPGFSLSGQVEGRPSGADVQVAKVKSDGSLEVISGVTAKTDVNGQFTLQTAGALPESTVVIVTKDSTKLMTLLDTAQKAVQVGLQTTVQTQVYQKAVEEGKTVTTQDIKAQVDSNVAAQIQGNDSAMIALIAGLDAATKAQNKFLTDSGVGLASTSLLLITSARAGAQTRLQADLQAASGDTAKVRAAYEAYHGTLMDAYSKAGLDASAYARSQQVYAQALVNNSLGLLGNARVTLIRSAHSQAARGLRAAMEIQLKASGSGDATLKTLVEAGAVLQASIDASTSLDAIAAAYDGYHASAVTALRATFVLQSMAIETLDNKIHAADGARGTLMASLKASSDADAVAKAHIDFASQVDAQVKSAFSGGLNAPSGAQINATTQVLILANMCG